MIVCIMYMTVPVVSVRCKIKIEIDMYAESKWFMCSVITSCCYWYQFSVSVDSAMSL